MKEIGIEVIKKRSIDNIQLDNKIMTIGVRSLSGNKIKTGRVESTDGNTYFDLDNRRLIVNDGTNDRVLIGFQSNGF